MRNVGYADRIIRLFMGIFLLAVGLGPFFGSTILADIGPVWHWLALIVGVVLVATGLMRTCPAYRLVGIDTNKRG